MSDLTERFFAPAPAARAATLRILVGGFAVVALLVELPEYLRVADRDPSRFESVGPLFFLADPLGSGTARLMLALTIACGIAFVIGWRFRIVGPAFALLFLAATTYRDSWGQLFHTDNLVAFHVLVLGFTRSADAWSLDVRSRSPQRPEPETGYGWPPRLMMGLVVATYFLGGVAKLRIAGSHWLTGDVLRNQVAFDNLRKILLGDIASPFAELALDLAWIWTPIALFTLLVELGAPVALLGGRLRVVWVICAWLFHVGILALMAIAFSYQLSGIAFACFFAVERTAARGVAAVRARISRRAPEPETAAIR